MAYSGKKINDIGAYNECRSSKGLYYVLTSVNIRMLNVHLGLCIPQECPIEVIQEYKGVIASMISRFTDFEVRPENLIFSDSAEKNEKLNRWSAGAIVVVAVVGLLIAWELLATVLDYNGYLNSTSPSLLAKFILCFSYQKNARGLLTLGNKVDERLEILNGVRVLAMWWVVVAHSFVTQMLAPLANLEDAFDDAVNSFFLATIKAGTVAVDIFFFLSGFLAALSFIQVFSNPEARNPMTFLSSYLKRYIRLTPTVLVLMLYTIFFQPMLFNTPTSPATEVAAHNCSNHWYETLLYVANLTSGMAEMCNPWIWYLFVDIQLYLITPFLILPYCIKKKAGYVTLLLACVAAFTTDIVICCHYNLNLSVTRPPPMKEYFEYEYIKPYCRAFPYLIGMAFFIFTKEGTDMQTGSEVCVSVKNKVYRSKLLRYSFYIAGVFIMSALICTFYLLDKFKDGWSSSLGNAHIILTRPLFVIGLTLVLYPVLIGRGKPLLAVLGHFMFGPMGRLTYGVYMVHMPIFYAIVFDRLQAEYYTVATRVVEAVMVFVLSYIVSFVLTIVFESPSVQLLKLSNKPRECARDYKLLTN